MIWHPLSRRSHIASPCRFVYESAPHRATGNVYEGTVDLQPTLDRISSGVKYPSRNDGTTFNNNEGLLPQQPAGYYTEYVVPTPNVKGVGPQRIVTGKNGEVFYTPDHYKTFTPVKR
ncbi:ribonuclease domain-containing protein [Cupriavidus pinatubonensis]|uniref:ribonuclease domain-containing protein n=1 Tax=Cupriavidus pinatubonensis TaxID=248026 RepID=UPI001C635652